MSPDRFESITRKYAGLRFGVIGDFCLDRYLEIEPARSEISIETNLPVHNVVRVRSQPGGAGTILNNLLALEPSAVFPVGFCGEDGEGFELRRALQRDAKVRMEHFLTTELRRTFTYCKPLVVEPGKVPVELNRLDSKNWNPTPSAIEDRLMEGIRSLAKEVDAFVVLDQVDLPDTGVVTGRVLGALEGIGREFPRLLILGDSRKQGHRFPPMTLKMNRAELASLARAAPDLSIEETKRRVAELARRRRQAVFVTLSEAGMMGSDAEGRVEHLPGHPVRGEIDIVGAGDAVTANLTAALCGGGTIREALEMANAAASIVIHQLGTTGTASLKQIRPLLF